MADERGLEGIDPYDLQDAECARLASWFATLSPAELSEPSGCAGWTRHDVLAHLVAVEEYFEACLAGEVRDLIERFMASGAASLDEFNAAGVEAGASVPTPELLATWVSRNERNRAGFRAADGTDIDTSVGAYPCRLQAFHVAFEYAIHANDVDAPVAPDDVDARQEWLAGVARFALTEVKDGVSVDVTDGRFVVSDADREATFDRDTFVAGVAGRAPDGALTADHAALLDLGY